MPIAKKLLNHLEKNKIKYDVLEHKVVYTAYDLAQTTKKKLQEIVARDGHDARYWCQYQCEPRSSTMIAAELEWIKYVNLDDIPRKIPCVVLVDPAWKGTKNAGTGSDASFMRS